MSQNSILYSTEARNKLSIRVSIYNNIYVCSVSLSISVGSIVSTLILNPNLQAVWSFIRTAGLGKSSTTMYVCVYICIPRYALENR
ncbi:hypothetical protein F5B20DRAFT_526760 [Whalleya microplaca]|nr:hypothetical protein F5B20DRAFT_526760 [Whalleya microplaca]